MNFILFYTCLRANCKQQNTQKTKLFKSCFRRMQPLLSSAQKFFSCLQIARNKGRTVLKCDFFGIRGCCRTCLRERAEPGMRGFRKWRDRNRWMCLCFECLCRRCVRRVYGKCMA